MILKTEINFDELTDLEIHFKELEFLHSIFESKFKDFDSDYLIIQPVLDNIWLGRENIPPSYSIEQEVYYKDENVLLIRRTKKNSILQLEVIENNLHKIKNDYFVTKESIEVNEENEVLEKYVVALFELFMIAKLHERSYPYVLFSLESISIMEIPFFNEVYELLNDNGFIYLDTNTKDFHYLINEDFLTEQDIFLILTTFKISTEERKYEDNQKVLDLLFRKVINFYKSKKSFN